MQPDNEEKDGLAERIKILESRIAELEKLEISHAHIEQELRKTEFQLMAILDNIPDMAWLKDKESRFIRVNEAFGKACGFSSQDLTGKTDLDVWPKDLAQRYRTDDKAVMSSGLEKRVQEPLSDKDGNISWIETIKRPIYNENGEVMGTVGIARDITERKQMEERLRESRAELGIRVKVRTAELSKVNDDLRIEINDRRQVERKLRREKEKAQLYLDIVGVIIIVISADHKVLLMNRKGCELLGYSQEEIIGKDWFDNFIPEMIREEVRGVFAKLLAGEIKAIDYYTNSVLTKSGQEKIIAWHNTLIRDEQGVVVSTLSSGDDVTERGRD